jgi:hypothetical protein
MTPKQRDELLSTLRELWDEMPDLRFGQMVVNLSYLAREPSHSATWDMEDDELLQAAQQLLEERQGALTST